jgi:hypothetical protein
MRHNIVEGEPGIFPDPIARFFRWVFGPLRRREQGETKDQETRDPGEERKDT